jgi:hypothetical protein
MFAPTSGQGPPVRYDYMDQTTSMLSIAHMTHTQLDPIASMARVELQWSLKRNDEDNVRYLELQREASNLLLSYCQGMITLIEAMIPSSGQPLRNVVCPEPSCFKIFSSHVACAQHCRNMHRRNLVYVPTPDMPDIPCIPNVTGEACALVVSVTLLACLELPDDFAPLYSEADIQRRDRFGRCPPMWLLDTPKDPVDAAIITPSAGAAWRLGTTLEQATNNIWSLHQPQTVADTLEKIFMICPKYKQITGFTRVLTCEGECGYVRTTHEHILGTAAKRRISLDVLAGLPIGRQAPGDKCPQCVSARTMQIFDLNKEHFIVHVPNGLTTLDNPLVPCGEASHEINFRVVAVVVTAQRTHNNRSLHGIRKERRSPVGVALLRRCLPRYGRKAHTSPG